MMSFSKIFHMKREVETPDQWPPRNHYAPQPTWKCEINLLGIIVHPNSYANV